jgi:hypothetical protein
MPNESDMSALPSSIENGQEVDGVRAPGRIVRQVFSAELVCGCVIAVSVRGEDVCDWIEHGYVISVHDTPQKVPIPCVYHRSANAVKSQPVETSRESADKTASEVKR